MNLRGRLQKIRALGKQDTPSATQISERCRDAPPALLKEYMFSESGFLTLRRTVYINLTEPLNPHFTNILSALIPGIQNTNADVKAENLVFFDLETTGLSGGAGTVAFLAAFGRFENGNYCVLKVEQYLLLDYPGEIDFLQQIYPFFSLTDSGHTPIIVSFNGKSFDSQIIRNRYIVKGLEPPVFCHADILYTARCLWKKILPSCSQIEIEKNILKIERINDTSGARAPDIWFSFLKTNDTAELAGVCEHNILDIAGLASMFSIFNNIANDPVNCDKKYNADTEALALRIRRHRRLVNELPDEIIKLENQLLEKAASCGAPLAMYVLGKDLFKTGRYDKGRAILRHLAELTDTTLAAAANRALAIDSEWRLMNLELALYYTGKMLLMPNIGSALKNDAEKRRARLLRKKSGISASLFRFQP